MMRPMTIYDLRQAFLTTLAPFYSASLGSIQVAVRKLLAEGFIAFDEQVERGRRKKIYRIGDSGRDAFREGMTSTIQPARLEVTALSRLSFLGLVEERQSKVQILTIIIETIEGALTVLEQGMQELETVELPPYHRPIFTYQTKTLDYGIMAHRAALDWFRNLRNEIEGEA